MTTVRRINGSKTPDGTMRVLEMIEEVQKKQIYSPRCIATRYYVEEGLR